MKKTAGFGFLMAGLLVVAGGLGGCAWFAAAYNQSKGPDVVAEYKGLADKSVAIVIYADQAHTFEYPQARKEISQFVATALRQTLPKIKLLDPDLVIAWQDDTFNWSNMPEKDIGKHFGVERVMYIELIEYGTREPDSADLLRGRIRANCKVFEVDTPGAGAVWQQAINDYWPENGPLDAGHSNDLAVRKHVLESFSYRLAGAFYDHEGPNPTVRDKMDQN